MSRIATEAKRCCGKPGNASHSSNASSVTAATGDRRLRPWVARTGPWTLEIVKQSDLPRFVVLPKRWTVERTLAWISRNRRLPRDYKRHTRKAAALVWLAMTASC
jgi:transposase